MGGMAVRVTKCPFVVWTPLLHGVHHTKSSCHSLLPPRTVLSVNAAHSMIDSEHPEPKARINSFPLELLLVDIL